MNELSFVGITNYIRLLTQDIFFYKSLFNTFILIVFAIPIQFVTGLFLAVAISEIYNKSISKLIRITNFFPYITTPIAIGLLFQVLFDWQNGTVNYLLSSLGMLKEPINWLGLGNYARLITILLIWWKYYGYFMIILLSGISTIPTEIYEAAQIDGAKWKDTLFRITIPQLRPFITFIITTSVIGGLQTFDEPAILFSGLALGGSASTPIGGPERAVLTSIMNLYDVGFQRFEYGYGCSIAFVMFIIIFILSMTVFKIINKEEEV